MSAFLNERDVTCPYCGEPFTILVDASAGSQSYIEDCVVCCRPVRLDILVDGEGELLAVTANREED